MRQGQAYYAFDTPEELEQKRREIPNFQYGQAYRDDLHNSLSLTERQVDELLDAHTPHVIRIKMPPDERVSFHDMIRGQITFETNQIDDKVLLKADGMPTYHLAVVVDDYLMKISHAFRGEEWLPSAPVHLLLWDYLGWKADMPQWAHLPLILKPDGHGKLSKRDGARLGFPVYAMNWLDPKTGELTPGFRELGFLPEAFINLLATLGWNDGTDQELFTLDELIEKFSLERVSKAGAKFDFEKAKWFNAEWIRKISPVKLEEIFREQLKEKDIPVEKTNNLQFIIQLVQDRLVFTTDLWKQSFYFFVAPSNYNLQPIQSKWNEEKNGFFDKLILNLKKSSSSDIKSIFEQLAIELNLKENDLLLPFRIMLVGDKYGPGVFQIAGFLDKTEVINRIEKALIAFNN